MTTFWTVYSIILIVVVGVVFSLMTIESKGELIEVSQINSNLSLDVQLEKKIINSNNKQTISFFLQDISKNKTIDAKIEGNIIYLSGMAESFSINITNNQLYNYSWIINPKTQFYGTILLDIYMTYNGSKTNVANLSFSVEDDDNNIKNDRNKFK